MNKIMLLVVALATFVVYADENGAKSLFCADSGVCSQSQEVGRSLKAGQLPNKKQSKQAIKPMAPNNKFDSRTGLAYWIEKQSPDGNINQVPASHNFKSGERININFLSNRDGYLYVVNLGTTGNATILYPRKSATGMVVAGQTIAVPGNGYMRFDNNAGEETIMAILSPTPLGNSDVGSSDGNRQAVSNSGSSVVADACGAKDLIVATNNCGSKDLLVEDDFSSGSATHASYAIAPFSPEIKRKSMNLVLKLKHE
ncbi:MAG: DUF4384 domain-containing protein [Cyclobacteriaceae bacterium]|nr:DUF4384 domain-containing protein [Cyclobacteriaceae bacterium]